MTKNRISAYAVPLCVSWLIAGCAQQGLETAALSLNDPAAASAATSPVEPVTGQPLPPIAAAQTAAPQGSALEVSKAAETAITQARTLRADNKKTEALALLDQTPGADTDLAMMRERGMLALEVGNMDRARDLLAKVEASSPPDWHVYSALGSALSASGKQAEAQEKFAKALQLAPDNSTVLNNLALSYALDKKHDDAEQMLRRAAITPDSQPKTKQNLALILGLKGNVAEARKVSEAVLSPEDTSANMTYVAQMTTAPSSSMTALAKVDPTEMFKNNTVSDQPIMQLGGVPDGQ
jgi:Flp pilus assembly protein TadD